MFPPGTQKTKFEIRPELSESDSQEEFDVFDPKPKKEENQLQELIQSTDCLSGVAVLIDSLKR